VKPGLVAAAVFMSLGAIDAGAAAQIIEQVLVQVNGDILTRTQMDERVRSVLAQQQGRPIAAVDLAADPQLRQQADALIPRVAADAIDELLVLQRARDLGFHAGDEDVDRVIARIRLDNNVASDAQFTALLREQGIPPDGLRASIRNQILIEQVRQEVVRRVRVTEPEAENYYRDNLAAFSAGPAVSYREILVALPPLEETRASATTALEYDRGLIRLVKARDRLARGEAFADVARDMSDAPSKVDGGAVGPIDPRALTEELRAPLATLTVGEVGPPIRTEQGYTLLRLESVAMPQTPTFAAFRERVVTELLSHKQAAAFAEHLHKLRAQALIKWKDLSLKAAWDGATRGVR
jgi:peptidyl-prolyl cis-trans isomerase SurA